MDRCEYVFHDHPFIEQDSVFVVVAFPVHVTDKDVLAERKFTVGCAGSVSQNITLFNPLADFNNRTLVNACALVRTAVFDQLVGFQSGAVIPHRDVVCIHLCNDAGILCQNTYAGVNCTLVLNARRNNRCLRRQQRYCLTLHVGTHQCTVRVVIFKERDHRRCDGNHHLRRNVDKVNFLPVYRYGIIAVTAGNTFVRKAPVLIQRFGSLCNLELIFHIRCHVDNFICHTAGSLFHSAERGNQEAILVCSGKGSEVRDKADVRSFRSLDRAKTAVMAVVNVSNIKRSSLSGKAAGAKG